MFILYAIPIGLVAGKILGGRVQALASFPFRWAWLMYAGLAVQLVLFSAPVAAVVGSYGPPIYVGSTLAVLAGLVRNIRLSGIALVVAGATANLAAILANGGSMPTTREALESAGRSIPWGYSNSLVLDDSPNLAPLTDIFALPPAVPLANVFSVGDVLIALGVVVAIAWGMRQTGTGRAPEGTSTPDISPLRGDNSYR